MTSLIRDANGLGKTAAKAGAEGYRRPPGASWGGSASGTLVRIDRTNPIPKRIALETATVLHLGLQQGLVEAHYARSVELGVTSPLVCNPGIALFCEAGYTPGVRELQEMGLEPALNQGSPWDHLEFPLPYALSDAAVPVQLGDLWLLVYRMKRSDGTTILLAGGPPNPAPEVGEEWRELDWQIPASLAHMYQFHDGLGPIDGSKALWWRDSILPADRLTPLTRHVRFGEENILYRPGDHLLASPDGDGGGWCFQREAPDDVDPTMVHWDSVSHRVAGSLSFRKLLRRLTATWLGAG